MHNLEKKMLIRGRLMNNVDIRWSATLDRNSINLKNIYIITYLLALGIFVIRSSISKYSQPSQDVKVSTHSTTYM